MVRMSDSNANPTGYTISSDGNTITFTSSSSLAAYTANAANAASLDGKTIILSASNKNASDPENIYTLDDLLPSGTAFSKATSVVIEGYATLTDTWTHFVTSAKSYTSGITSITMEGNAALRVGASIPNTYTPNSNEGESSRTGLNHFETGTISYGSSVTADSPVFYEMTYTKENLTASTTRPSNTVTLNNIPIKGYIDTSNASNSYIPTGSAVQFRIVDADGKFYDDKALASEVKSGLSITSIGNGTSGNNGSGVSAIGSHDPNYRLALPTLGFDDNLFYVNTASGSGGVTNGENLIDNIIIHDTEPCFLKGSLLETPSGWIKVEDLSIGDMIFSYENGKKTVRAITWIGHSEIVNAQEESYPVKIARHALADNVPFADLYITPEHCLFLDGCFVPVRMLVNERSIVTQTDLHNFEIYHIELQNHSVINAQGVLTESFLDTRNHTFALKSTSNVEKLSTSHKEWNTDSAAPLNVKPDFVEPLYKMIEQRAVNLNMERVRTYHTLTQVTNLSFVNQSGLPILSRKKDGWFLLTLPAGTTKVSILSNATKPSDAIGPYWDDRRKMGVLVKNALHLRKTDHIKIDMNTQSYASQWYANTDSTYWTNGNSSLLLAPCEEQTILALEISGGGPYVISEDEVLDTIKVA